MTWRPQAEMPKSKPELYESPAWTEPMRCLDEEAPLNGPNT